MRLDADSVIREEYDIACGSQALNTIFFHLSSYEELPAFYENE